MFRRLFPKPPTFPGHPGRTTRARLLPGIPPRLPRVLLLATAGLLAGSGVATAAPSASPATPATVASGPAAPSSSQAGPASADSASSTPVAASTPALSSPSGADPACAVGELCLWNSETYSGQNQHYDLRTANPEDCIVLPEGFEAHSFANRLTRDVTVYQSEECSTEGDFTTYPGGGTYVPQSPFVVRAIKIWN
jgi:hypothetical protein